MQILLRTRLKKNAVFLSTKFPQNKVSLWAKIWIQLRPRIYLWNHAVAGGKIRPFPTGNVIALCPLYRRMAQIKINRNWMDSLRQEEQPIGLLNSVKNPPGHCFNAGQFREKCYPSCLYLTCSARGNVYDVTRPIHSIITNVNDISFNNFRFSLYYYIRFIQHELGKVTAKRKAIT